MKGKEETINILHLEIKEIKKEYNETLNELRKSLEFTQKEGDDIKKEIAQMKIENAKLNAMVGLHKDDIFRYKIK